MSIKDEILDSREERRFKIDFLKSSFKTVITAKTNIPGDDKKLNIAYILINLFEKLIPEEMKSYSEFVDGVDGPYYLLASNYDSDDVKTLMMTLEETHSLGRFIDLDVYASGKVMTRGKLRKCYLCNKDAFVCIREQNHDTKELISFMEAKLKNYLEDELVSLIEKCILMELDLHPKFGLVTPLTQGSHSDMNYQIMLKAKDAILPFFRKMFEVSWADKSIDDIYRLIRLIGIQAEQAMLQVTNNINAYKGLIFGMGILVSAYGYSLYNNIGIDKVFNVVSEISKPFEKDFQKGGNTFGMQAYTIYGIKGARGEAIDGMPHVQKALSYLKDYSEESLLNALMFLISESDDTVLLKRVGNFDNYQMVKELFKNQLDSGQKSLVELNEYCLKNKLSFGGSADLLILTIFMKKIADFI